MSFCTLLYVSCSWCVLRVSHIDAVDTMAVSVVSFIFVCVCLCVHTVYHMLYVISSLIDRFITQYVRSVYGVPVQLTLNNRHVIRVMEISSTFYHVHITSNESITQPYSTCFIYIYIVKKYHGRKRRSLISKSVIRILKGAAESIHFQK